MNKQNKNVESLTVNLENKTFSWKAPAYAYYEKPSSWYFWVIILALGLGAAFYFIQNYFGMATVLVIGIYLFLTGKQKPDLRLYVLNKKGIKIDEKFYPMEDFKSFFVSETNGIKNLHFDRLNRISLPINALLENVDAQEVINFLKLYLPEDGKGSSLNDKISGWTKI